MNEWGEPIGNFKRGSEVIFRGTIDTWRNGRVYVIVDGEVLGRVVAMPDDVIAIKTGDSPNYEDQRKPRFTAEELRQHRKLYNADYRARRKNERGNEG